MSEKSLWEWLKKKMGDNWSARRLEKNAVKGIPDTVIRPHGHPPTFMELKDWSGPKKHPLLIEQLNFLNDFWGIVLIKTDKDTMYVVHSDFHPLLISDINYVKRAGTRIARQEFTPDKFIEVIYGEAPRRHN